MQSYIYAPFRIDRCGGRYIPARVQAQLNCRDESGANAGTFCKCQSVFYIRYSGTCYMDLKVSDHRDRGTLYRDATTWQLRRAQIARSRG